KSSKFPGTRTSNCCLWWRSKERSHSGNQTGDFPIAWWTPYQLHHGDLSLR
ncbi:hypothetical protein DPMN_182499, partial [Dreissena polymorpha]